MNLLNEINGKRKALLLMRRRALARAWWRARRPQHDALDAAVARGPVGGGG